MKLSLQEITDRILTSKPSILEPGLMYGRTGIAIYLFHYSKHIKTNAYNRKAILILGNLEKEISSSHSVDYASGFSGIGCGLEYLYKEGFIDNYPYKFLQEIDKKIFHSIIYMEHRDNSLFTGLSGFGRYLLFRAQNLNSPENILNNVSNKMGIIHLIDKIEHSLSEITIYSEDVYKLLCKVDQLKIYPSKTRKLIQNYHQQKKANSPNYTKNIATNNNGNPLTSSTIGLGLHNGYAGIGMDLLTKQDSWHQRWRSLL